MAEINVLNTKFENSGKINTQVDLSAEAINVAVVHQAINAARASRRQGTACTKTKAEVSGGGKKPFKQKGTGNARQGSTRNPHMVGGGVAFGPTPRDYTQKMNKKMALNAIQSILADKLQAGKLSVVESLPTTGKTKELYKALSDRKLLPALIVVDNKESTVIRAARNLQYGKALAVEGFSVYEAVKYENLIIEKAAMEKLLNKLV